MIVRTLRHPFVEDNMTEGDVASLTARACAGNLRLSPQESARLIPGAPPKAQGPKSLRQKDCGRL
jgi:hypothetical protein